MKVDHRKLRLVFDTNVYISMLGFRGRYLETLWKLILENSFHVYISNFILEEISKNLIGKAHLNLGEAASILRFLRTRFMVIEPQESLSIIKEKDSDNRILECAVAAQADYLVTGDFKHIRPLSKFKGIHILTPREFLDFILNIP